MTWRPIPASRRATATTSRSSPPATNRRTTPGSGTTRDNARIRSFSAARAGACSAWNAFRKAGSRRRRRTAASGLVPPGCGARTRPGGWFTGGPSGPSHRVGQVGAVLVGRQQAGPDGPGGGKRQRVGQAHPHEPAPPYGSVPIRPGSATTPRWWRRSRRSPAGTARPPTWWTPPRRRPGPALRWVPGSGSSA